MTFTQDHPNARSKTTKLYETSCYRRNLMLRTTITTSYFVTLIFYSSWLIGDGFETYDGASEVLQLDFPLLKKVFIAIKLCLVDKTSKFVAFILATTFVVIPSLFHKFFIFSLFILFIWNKLNCSKMLIKT